MPMRVFLEVVFIQKDRNLSCQSFFRHENKRGRKAAKRTVPLKRAGGVKNCIPTRLGENRDKSRFFRQKENKADFARLYKDKNGRAVYEMNFSRSRPFFVIAALPRSFYKIASTKLLASNFSRSSIFSPVPAKMTGRANSEANENTKPPFAVPSNLVRTRPSSSTASSNVRA